MNIMDFNSYSKKCITPVVQNSKGYWIFKYRKDIGKPLITYYFKRKNVAEFKHNELLKNLHDYKYKEYQEEQLKERKNGFKLIEIDGDYTIHLLTYHARYKLVELYEVSWDINSHNTWNTLEDARNFIKRHKEKQNQIQK